MQGVAHFLQGPSRSVPGWRQGSRRSTPLGPSPPLLEAPGPSFRTPSPHLPWTPPRTPPWTPSLEPRGWVQGPQKFVEKFVGKIRRKIRQEIRREIRREIRQEIRQEIRREIRWENPVRILIFGKFVEKIRPGLEGGMHDLQRISHTLKNSSKYSG